MKRLIGLLVVLFIVSSSQVFAQEKAKHKGPAGGFILGEVEIMGTLIHVEVSKQDLAGTYTWSDAIQACKDSREGGFSNWILPSKEVLNLMYQNSDKIGGFASYWFWSSSETSGNFAWYQDFNNGNQPYDFKDYHYTVRCVRAF